MGETLLVIICAVAALGWLTFFIKAIYDYDIMTSQEDQDNG